MIDKYDIFRNKFINQSVNDVQDPAFLTFGLRFEFNDRLEPGESLEPGLLTGRARSFLQSRGDSLRVQKLDYFTQLLIKFSIDEPWWFTSVAGLDKLLEMRLSGGRLPEDASFTVTARESIDLKFISFMESYRSLVQDKVWMREILTRNLKKFDMSVYLVDQRILVRPQNGGPTLEYDNDTQGVMVLKLADCEFDFNSYSSFLSNVSNETPGDPVTHSFDIKVNRVFESYNLPTGFVYGYSGTGYYSDDTREDFNFIQNIIRPNSMSQAQAGNTHRIKDEDYQSYKDSNDVNLPTTQRDNRTFYTVEEEPVEVEREDRSIEINDLTPESNTRETLELGTLEAQSQTRQQLDLNMEPVSQRRENINLRTGEPDSQSREELETGPKTPESQSRQELDLSAITPISNTQPRTIL